MNRGAVDSRRRPQRLLRLEACRKLGAHEIFFDPMFSPEGESLDRVLSRI